MAIKIIYDEEIEEFEEWQRSKKEREESEKERAEGRKAFEYQNALDAAFGLKDAIRTQPKTAAGKIAKEFCSAGDNSWIAEDIKAEATQYGVPVHEIPDYHRYISSRYRSAEDGTAASEYGARPQKGGSIPHASIKGVGNVGNA